ncbi:MAG: hypothetical protein J1F35_05805 [Erysipelotrichales bacterium]|nr:hypothetical protein [Erysipelotrichales bacterium]
MKAIKDYINEDNIITEDQMYDDMIQKLQEAKENNIPIDEGLFSAILGGITGVTFGPAIMKTLCKILGVDPKGSFGSLLTSRLVLGALATEIGWRQ